MEVYCDGRLDLFKPYWRRTVALTGSKVFFAWATKTHASGGMTDGQYEVYRAAADLAAEAMNSGDYEIAKLGHIGSNDGGTTYYVGQFVLLLKEHGGGPIVHLFVGDDVMEASSFLFDQAWRPGGRRRKFFGFYDPLKLYAAAKQERAFAAKAEGRRGAAPEAEETAR